MNTRKPKIGLLALMTDGYESIFSGINKRQFKYAKELEKLLSSVRVDGYFITSEVEIDYVTRITKEETVLFQSPVLKKTIK